MQKKLEFIVKEESDNEGSLAEPENSENEEDAEEIEEEPNSQQAEIDQDEVEYGDGEAVDSNAYNTSKSAYYSFPEDQSLIELLATFIEKTNKDIGMSGFWVKFAKHFNTHNFKNSSTLKFDYISRSKDSLRRRFNRIYRKALEEELTEGLDQDEARFYERARELGDLMTNNTRKKVEKIRFSSQTHDVNGPIIATEGAHEAPDDDGEEEEEEEEEEEAEAEEENVEAEQAANGHEQREPLVGAANDGDDNEGNGSDTVVADGDVGDQMSQHKLGGNASEGVVNLPVAPASGKQRTALGGELAAGVKENNSQLRNKRPKMVENSKQANGISVTAETIAVSNRPTPEAAGNGPALKAVGKGAAHSGAGEGIDGRAQDFVREIEKGGIIIDHRHLPDATRETLIMAVRALENGLNHSVTAHSRLKGRIDEIIEGNSISVKKIGDRGEEYKLALIDKEIRDLRAWKRKHKSNSKARSKSKYKYKYKYKDANNKVSKPGV